MRRSRFAILAVAWMAVIFIGSSTPATAQGTSLTPLIDWILHNGAHFLEYGLLAWLVQRATGHWLFAVSFCIAFGLSDEWYQSFVPGRESSLIDMAFDAIGAALGLVVGKLLRRRATALHST